jgi:hypothetical protein
MGLERSHCCALGIGGLEMGVRRPRYPKEEFAARGDLIYDRDIRPLVEADHKGEFVAIDIETGAWEIDADPLIACDRLIARIPDCQTWLVRVGSPYLHRLGGPRRVAASERADR